MLFETPYDMILSVAERFKRTRKAKKISLKTLSEKSGVPYSTIRRFESTGEISFLSFAKIVSTIGEDEQIDSLFTDRTPASIEEVIRGYDK